MQRRTTDEGGRFAGPLSYALDIIADCRYQCQHCWQEGEMPGSLSVRNLGDALVLSLKRRAARHGRSAEAEVREILRHTLAQEPEPGFDDLAAELRALTAGRAHTPAEALLRESRDER